MAFDFENQCPVNCRQVDLTQAEECNYWVSRFQVPEAQVEEAVRMMGSDLGSVCAYLSVFSHDRLATPQALR